MDYAGIAASMVVCLAFATVLFFCVREYYEAFREQLEIERRERRPSDLFEIYDQIWSGDPADRPAAWFRVIGYLERNGYPAEVIKEARICWRLSENDNERSSFLVNSNGRLIRVDQRGGCDECFQ